MQDNRRGCQIASAAPCRSEKACAGQTSHVPHLGQSSSPGADCTNTRHVFVSFALQLHISASAQMYASTVTAYQCTLHTRCSSAATFSTRRFSLENLPESFFGVTK